MKNIQSFLLTLVIILVSFSAYAANNDLSAMDPSRIPVKITSERMTYDEKLGTVTFKDNVVAEHGELTLWADKLTAYLLPSKTGASAEAIDHIIAEGNVRAKKANSEGFCGKLTYVVAKQFLKMEINPKLKDGPNSLTGKIINFYAAENRSEVVGSKGQRVRAIFLAPGGAK